jgi:G patch domain-containing protein 1
MDDEDLQELQNGKRMVDTTPDFMDKEDLQELPYGKWILDISTKDSVGAQLLRKMGWRLGQGVGPRVTYDQLRKQDLVSSSLAVSSSVNELDEDDEEAKKHLHAPRDTAIIVFRPKENSFGLGYAPGAALSEMFHEHGSEKNTGAPKISGTHDLCSVN